MGIGQYSNVPDFGLYYYNARWYDGYLNHFTQPDSIIPNPGNVLDWNRYSYVRYNPIRYNDPSGHYPQCGPDGIWCSNNFEESYSISFGENWSERNKAKVKVAVELVAGRLASEMGLDNPAMAFSLIYGAVHFQMGDCDECKGGGGYAYGYQKRKGYHLIAFESITGMSSTNPNAFMRGVKNIVHELAHIYNSILGKGPEQDLNKNQTSLLETRSQFLRPNLDSTGGICPLCLDWQQHPPEYSEDGKKGSETFADMFIAWTLNAWNTGTSIENVLAVSKAQAWMEQWMP